MKALASFYDFYLTPFLKWPPRKMANHIFAYNSASRVHRNEILVSTPMFLRVRNSIKALTSFCDFYLIHSLK